MPAERGQITKDAPANAAVRDQIGLSDPEVAKEALQQLTWLGVDAVLIHKALEAARQIVRTIPEDDYDEGADTFADRMNYLNRQR